MAGSDGKAALARPVLRPLPTAALAIAVLGAVVVDLVWPGPWGDGVLSLTLMGLIVTWGIISLRIARRRSHRERSAWIWFAAAALGTLAGVGLWILVAAAAGSLGSAVAQSYLPSSADAIFTTAFVSVTIYAIAFVGILQLARIASGPSGTLRLSLDAAIVAGCLFFIVWSAAYRDVFDQSRLGLGTRVTLLAYPVLDSALATLAFMAFATPSPGRPAAYRILLVGFLLLVVGDTAGTYLIFLQQAAGLALETNVQAVAIGLIVLGSMAVSRGPSWRPAPVPVRPWVELLPLAPLGLAILSAAESEREHGALSSIQFWTALLVISLAMVRLAYTLLQNLRLNQRLEQSAAAKEQLLRFVSHEMGNPLSPLVVQLRLARRAQDPARMEHAWQIIDRSMGRLTTLSRDVRDLALAESGRLVPALATTPLADQVTAACRSSEPLAAAKGVALTWEAGPADLLVRVDPGRFGQALDNLLSNALKFTEPGGKIVVRVGRSGGMASVEVTDSGIGLTPEQARELFGLFARPHDQAPGLGLGLYLSRQIMQTMGGDIEASSPGPGLGSTFRATVPVAVAPATPGTDGGARPR